MLCIPLHHFSILFGGRLFLPSGVEKGRTTYVHPRIQRSVTKLPLLGGVTVQPAPYDIDTGLYRSGYIFRTCNFLGLTSHCRKGLHHLPAPPITVFRFIYVRLPLSIEYARHARRRLAIPGSGPIAATYITSPHYLLLQYCILPVK
jgi:hypothetical protein